MLVDAGEESNGLEVVEYLRSQGVTRLEYLIGTHPHADHIGGLSAVLNAFPVDTILLPKTEHTSYTYETLLNAIAKQGKQITAPKALDTYYLGQAQFQILSSGADAGDNLNNASIVFRLSFGANSFLFTGDAENEMEAALCQMDCILKSDVLKVGHHGSDTSSTEAFLDAVSPQMAVIPVGNGNDYGHPAQAVLARLAAREAMVFRTDLDGTVVITGDGKHAVKSNPAAPLTAHSPPEQVQEEKKSAPEIKTPPVPEQEHSDEAITVYVTKSGTKYHREGCRYLRKSKIAVGLAEAKQRYGPCSVCKPPQ